jgi:hypothetical protein
MAFSLESWNSLGGFFKFCSDPHPVRRGPESCVGTGLSMLGRPSCWRMYIKLQLEKGLWHANQPSVHFTFGGVGYEV